MVCVFKVCMIFYVVYGCCIICEDGSYYEYFYWFELVKEKWM